MRTRDLLATWILGAVLLTFAMRSHGQGQSDEELATKLNNPVSSLISVPFQYNWDHEFGPDRNGHKSTLNIQPVIPGKVSSDWNLISRVIVPVVDQHIPSVGDGSQSGIGDITGEFFFVPARPSPSGVLWGVGPALVVPTHTNFISSDKWAVGPTAVIVKQEAGWTYALLFNHLWSVGGSGAQNISNTFIQPILSYTTKDAWTYSINTESSFDWLHSQWTVPINASVSKLTRLGTQPVSFGIGARYYANSPDNGPHGWGLRATVTLLFPE